MSIVKSFSVGNGDMFYINHGTDNFTIIDCCIEEEGGSDILGEIETLGKAKGITRFISTHPDEDHIRGLEFLDDAIGLLNFYCVRNQVTKDEVTDSFLRYCALRDDPKRAFYISRGCERRWMNRKDEERGASGIEILWPDPANESFKDALDAAGQGGSPNNISAIIQYELSGGVKMLWMGDLETEFLQAVESDLSLPPVDILFAPHHGRDSGKIPASMLERMAPKIIVIGEAPSEFLNYYSGYNTITQNSAGDILFDCQASKVDIFASRVYDVDFLDNDWCTRPGYHYVGTLSGLGQ